MTARAATESFIHSSGDDMHALTRIAVGVILVLPIAACHRASDAPSSALVALHQPLDRLDMTTWSVVAVDPANGDVGVAMASCVPNTYADALAALVPGKGAAATQAAFDVDNRNKVFAAIKSGMSADEIVRRVADSSIDSRLGNRQYGVVTMRNGTVTTAGFTGKPMLDGNTAAGARRWAGVRANAARGVSAQGNTLVSEAVVANALAAYVRDDLDGMNTLPDRLMRAVEAGSAAGGDVRCNTDSVRQTAATTMILVARGTDAPYAADKINLTDQGTRSAPWLALSVTVDKGGANPLIELRTRYDVWRRTMKR
jgi:uncharacterized Ntn-hydrolase superfamily protein